ncbi:hypothetical protein ACIPYS_13560 [Kitasatospora sp. NPDC089913]|nr:hypothetical protein [Streptomyces sp. TLI_053]SDT47725.1 hypothetical protein SAMN05216371_2452 [Streptomyces sp. TLI_053]
MTTVFPLPERPHDASGTAGPPPLADGGGHGPAAPCLDTAWD